MIIEVLSCWCMLIQKIIECKYHWIRKQDNLPYPVIQRLHWAWTLLKKLLLSTLKTKQEQTLLVQKKCAIHWAGIFVMVGDILGIICEWVEWIPSLTTPIQSVRVEVQMLRFGGFYPLMLCGSKKIRRANEASLNPTVPESGRFVISSRSGM